MESDLLDKVLRYYHEQKWRDLLELNKCEDANNLLWAWPSESNLEFIKKTIEEFNVEGIISIGCGCGLLEWLLEQYTGKPMIGYEVNEEWWRSKYSKPQFIELKFPEQPPSSDILLPNYALLFCYFNDGDAFREYIRGYGGSLVFIIGPGNGAGRHTDPEPFKPDFGTKGWLLHRSEEIRDTKDFIAAFIRVE